MLNKYKSLVIDKQKAVLALYASEKCEQVIIINYSTRNWIREHIQAFILFAQVTVPPPGFNKQDLYKPHRTIIHLKTTQQFDY